jgi:gamma-glutamyl-gamma-aminobutyrate hydrolase PuuD
VSPPLIGITAYPRVVEIVPVPALLHTANRYYVEAVARAGGCPLVLPVVDPALAAVAVGALDGLVLPGGGDVDPTRYGEPPAPETAAVDEERDAWEMACALAALDRDLPLLATCRGAQVLNVALGGSLVQHIPAATGASHSWSKRYTEEVHEVKVDPGSRLAGILGCDLLGTNSLHHQAVARPGAGVRPVAWAPDGTVEAFEVDGRREVVAVQWHPELMPDDPVQQRLFGDLVERAARRAL